MNTLSINLVGKETADLIANEYPTLEDIKKATIEDLTKIEKVLCL